MYIYSNACTEMTSCPTILYANGVITGFSLKLYTATLNEVTVTKMYWLLSTEHRQISTPQRTHHK